MNAQLLTGDFGVGEGVKVLDDFPVGLAELSECPCTEAAATVTHLSDLTSW